MRDKQIFLIQGFTTDIVTNSSSEIFTGIKHTEDAVKEIIENMFEVYNKNRTRIQTWGDDAGKTYEVPIAKIPDCLEIKVFDKPRNSDFDLWADYQLWDVLDYRHFEDDDGKVDWDAYYQEKEKLKSAFIESNWPKFEGTVYIVSTDDNSIPWEIQEQIVEIFNCNRTHLG